MPHHLTSFLHDESGQDLIEYALLAGVIGLGAIASMRSMATSLRDVFNALGTALTNAT